jgi:hypothetical protein
MTADKRIRILRIGHVGECQASNLVSFLKRSDAFEPEAVYRHENLDKLRTFLVRVASAYFPIR